MDVPDLLAAPALTGDRMVAAVAAVVALAGVVAGGLALLRSTTRRSTVAVVAGITGMIAGGLVVITADGGPGTGNGIVGGYAALTLGLIGAALGGLALARAGRG
jgi:hypothetical protein